MRERAPVFPAGSRYCSRSSRASASSGCGSPKARCARGCCTIWSGRFTDEDARVRSVRAMERRYHVDAPQADRVEATAVAAAAAGRIRLGSRGSARGAGAALGGAAARDRPRHRAFEVSPAQRLPARSMPTCPGFPREEQLLLSALVGGHRRQLSFDALEDLLPPWDRLAEFLIVLLRLSVLLHRGRSPQPLPEVGAAGQGPQPARSNCRSAG